MRKYFLLSIALLLFVNVARAQMSAHYINVGQADSILLEFKTGAILIDAGGEATGDDRDKDHLIAYLKQFPPSSLRSEQHIDGDNNQPPPY